MFAQFQCDYPTGEDKSRLVGRDFDKLETDRLGNIENPELAVVPGDSHLSRFYFSCWYERACLEEGNQGSERVEKN